MKELSKCAGEVSCTWLARKQIPRCRSRRFAPPLLHRMRTLCEKVCEECLLSWLTQNWNIPEFATKEQQLASGALGYVMRGHEQESWISEFRDESCERRRCESWKRIDSRQTCHLFTGFHFSFLHTPFIVQSAIISFTPPLPLSSLHSLQMPVVRPCMLEARDENEKSVFNVWII